jgi:hypothetical protein
MINLKVFYLLRVYWPLILIKMRLKKSAQKAHKLYKSYFKNYCNCAYVVQPTKNKLWCDTCKAYQKHGGWK